jgi:hypothetical protein
MAEPDSEQAQDRPTGGARPSASSMIAELWSEREQSMAPPPPLPVVGRPARSPRATDSRTGMVAAVVVLALLLGGGVGVFLATKGVGMPTTAQYVAKADAICRPSNGSVGSIVKPTSYPELATGAGTLVTTSDAQLGGLRKLSRPAGADGGRVAGLLSDMTETNSAGRGLQDAAGRSDDAATAAATLRLRSAATAASTSAKALGFTACATGMQPGVDAVAGGANGVVKTAFIAKADTLCRALIRTLDAIPRPKTGNAAIARYLTQTVQLMDGLIVDLKAMPVPPGDEATVGEFLGALGSLTAKWKETPAAATAGDVARLTAIEKEAAPMETAANAKLDAYGLGTCGTNFGG